MVYKVAIALESWERRLRGKRILGIVETPSILSYDLFAVAAVAYLVYRRGMPRNEAAVRLGLPVEVVREVARVVESYLPVRLFVYDFDVVERVCVCGCRGAECRRLVPVLATQYVLDPVSGRWVPADTVVGEDRVVWREAGEARAKRRRRGLEFLGL